MCIKGGEKSRERQRNRERERQRKREREREVPSLSLSLGVLWHKGWMLLRGLKKHDKYLFT